jgi:hypothetical protein
MDIQGASAFCDASCNKAQITSADIALQPV